MMFVFIALAALIKLVVASPASLPLSTIRARNVPQTSVCYCDERASNDYTISIWIVNKTTSEYGMLSQGLRDNFGVFCKGYFVLWSAVEPIVTNVVTGDAFPANTAPQQLGAHIDTGFVDLEVTGYVVGIDLENRPYDGCLSKVVERAEEMELTCPCPI